MSPEKPLFGKKLPMNKRQLEQAAREFQTPFFDSMLSKTETENNKPPSAKIIEDALGKEYVNDLPEKKGLFAQFRQGSGQIEVFGDNGELSPYKRKSGQKREEHALVVTEPLDEGNKNAFFKLLSNIKKNLLHSNQKREVNVDVVERRSSSEEPDIEERRRMLKDAGLLKGKVYISDQEIVWRTRTEKRRTREEIDYLDFVDVEPEDRSDRMRKASRNVRRSYSQARKEYKKDNFVVLERPEVEILGRELGRRDLEKGHPIMTKLRHTKFVQKDLSDLEKGFGLIVKAKICGCIVEVDLGGSWNILKKCHSGICQLER
ncbi:hypothetical protein JXA63_03940 [Candidatus Woesebacteria bacterium]|nr:hypothetical protein [Candidatus Woesebacteria bacterium]